VAVDFFLLELELELELELLLKLNEKP
jgi:hypothetical protein